MVRTSMVSQFPKLSKNARSPARHLDDLPGVQHSTYSMWMVSFSAVSPNSPRIFKNSLRTLMFRGRCPGVEVLNWTIGRAGRGQIPRSEILSRSETSSEKPHRRAPGATTLSTRTLPLQRDRHKLARSDALSRGFDPPRIRRTWPSATSRAARAPVTLATRANHSHLSSRCRSATPFLTLLPFPQ